MSGHSTPQREPEGRSDEIVIADGVGVGVVGCSAGTVHTSFRESEKARASRDLRDHSAQLFHFTSGPREGE